jgi:hypothetical protein
MMWPVAMLEELARERSRLRREIARSDTALGSADCSASELRSRVLMLRDAIGAYTDVEDELIPQVLKTLGSWGEGERSAMITEHSRRRATLESARRDLEALGTYEAPGDVYGITDVLVNLRSAVSVALDDEERLFRDAALRASARRPGETDD